MIFFNMNFKNVLLFKVWTEKNMELLYNENEIIESKLGFPKKAQCTKKTDFFFTFFCTLYKMWRRFNVQIQCTCTKSVNKKII